MTVGIKLKCLGKDGNYFYKGRYVRNGGVDIDKARDEDNYIVQFPQRIETGDRTSLIFDRDHTGVQLGPGEFIFRRVGSEEIIVIHGVRSLEELQGRSESVRQMIGLDQKFEVFTVEITGKFRRKKTV
jgi:hypothetical protein